MTSNWLVRALYYGNYRNFGKKGVGNSRKIIGVPVVTNFYQSYDQMFLEKFKKTFRNVPGEFFSKYHQIKSYTNLSKVNIRQL